MSRSDELKDVQIRHDRKEFVSKQTIQSKRIISSDIILQKQDLKKKNIFSDFLIFMSVGFGVSNLDSDDENPDSIRP